MTQQKLNTILQQLIRWGIYLVLFSPLFVSSQFIFPFITLKTTVFRIMVEILIVLYLVLVWQDRRFFPRLNTLLYAVFAFAGIQTLSSLLGVNLYASFWSNYERMWGLLTIFHGLAFFVIVFSLFRAREQWLQLFRVSLVASVLVSLYGVGQLLGFDMLFQSGSSRIEATIGNASFLAAYLLFHIFFAAYLFCEDKDRLWRFFYAFAFAVNVFILFYTATRGAIIAFLFSLIYILGYLFFSLPHKKVKRGVALGALAIILLSLSLYAARDSTIVKSIKPLNRVTHISLADSSVLSRLVVWDMSWQGFKQRPLLGYGEENYDVVFNRYYDSQVTEEWFDRAHNIVFDILIADGIVGLIAYFFIFVVAFRYLWQARHTRWYVFPLFSGLLIAYFLQNLFVFDTLNTWLGFLAVLSFVMYVRFGKEEMPDPVFRRLGMMPVLSMVVVLFIVVWAVNIRPMRANTRALSGYRYQLVNVSKTLQPINEAIGMGTYGSREISLQLGQIAMTALANKNMVKSDKKKMVDAAITALSRTIEQRPMDTRSIMTLAQLYQVGSRLDRSFVEKSVPLLKKARELSPGRLTVYYGLAQAEMMEGNFDKAVPYLEEAIAIAPQNGEPRYTLALAYLTRGDMDKAIPLLTEAESLGYDFKEEQYLKLIQLFVRHDRVDKTVHYYERMVSNWPDQAQYWASLADAYAQTGEYEKARDATERAVSLDDSFKEEASQFLKMIDEQERAESNK